MNDHQGIAIAKDPIRGGLKVSGYQPNEKDRFDSVVKKGILDDGGEILYSRWFDGPLTRDIIGERLSLIIDANNLEGEPKKYQGFVVVHDLHEGPCKVFPPYYPDQKELFEKETEQGHLDGEEREIKASLWLDAPVEENSEDFRIAQEKVWEEAMKS